MRFGSRWTDGVINMVLESECDGDGFLLAAIVGARDNGASLGLGSYCARDGRIVSATISIHVPGATTYTSGVGAMVAVQTVPADGLVLLEVARRVAKDFGKMIDSQDWDEGDAQCLAMELVEASKR